MMAAWVLYNDGIIIREPKHHQGRASTVVDRQPPYDFGLHNLQQQRKRLPRQPWLYTPPKQSSWMI